MASMHLTLTSADLEPQNMPVLQNLMVTSNGIFDADNLINIGASTSAAPVSPLVRKAYLVNTGTNCGKIFRLARPLFQSLDFRQWREPDLQQ